jgi:hypothetical protein
MSANDDLLWVQIRHSQERHMLRAILGWLIIAHAFAHASAGVWSATQGTMWIATAVWTVAFLALLCAGLGLLRVPGLRRMWHATLIAGCVA